MRYGIYSVYDSKSETYTRPFYADNDGVAQRFAYDVYVNTDSVMSHHPEDFNLYWLGEFDDCTGILSVGALRHVVAFTSFFSSVELDVDGD